MAGETIGSIRGRLGVGMTLVLRPSPLAFSLAPHDGAYATAVGPLDVVDSDLVESR